LAEYPGKDADESFDHLGQLCSETVTAVSVPSRIA
jgi:hypothetical protein